MFEKINVFSHAMARARHSGLRQSVVAQNIANSDTPGYQPKDVRPLNFSQNSSAAFSLVATRASHLNASHKTGFELVASDTPQGNPNGNAVSLEEEMLKAVDAKRNHDQALAIYKSSLRLMRSSLGR